jgi:hypothetical protein
MHTTNYLWSLTTQDLLPSGWVSISKAMDRAEKLPKLIASPMLCAYGKKHALQQHEIPMMG